MEYRIKDAFHTHNSPSAHAAGVTVVVLCVCVCYHIFGDIARYKNDSDKLREVCSRFL